MYIVDIMASLLVIYLILAIDIVTPAGAVHVFDALVGSSSNRPCYLCLSVKELVSSDSMLLKPHQPSH